MGQDVVEHLIDDFDLTRADQDIPPEYDQFPMEEESDDDSIGSQIYDYGDSFVGSDQRGALRGYK